VIGTKLPTRWPFLASSVACFIAAGTLWSILGVLLAELRESFEAAPSSLGLTHETAIQGAIRKKGKLHTLFVAAALASLTALVLVPFGPLMAP
jgi:hypothetical protein